MRKVVLAMMTTLNGRLDDPGAWVTGLSDDHYEEIRPWLRHVRHHPGRSGDR